MPTGTKLNVQRNHTFGLLTVIKEVDKFVQPSGQKQRAFLCECICGKTTVVRLSHLRFGRVVSCGCVAGEKHGMSKTALYTIWRGMKNRCYGKKTIQPHIYKDRGILVCGWWKLSFLSFRAWALQNGYRDGLQIDRIDNDGNYEPSNCRFVTNTGNSNNRRDTFFVNYKGKNFAFCLLLREKGLYENVGAIRGRIARGWTVDRAIDTPIKKGNYQNRWP